MSQNSTKRRYGKLYVERIEKDRAYCVCKCSNTIVLPLSLLPMMDSCNACKESRLDRLNKTDTFKEAVDFSVKRLLEMPDLATLQKNMTTRTPQYTLVKLRAKMRAMLYKHYYRGINIYNDWLEDVDSLIEYVSQLPNAPADLCQSFKVLGVCLDLIDPNKGFMPGNVKWTTSSVIRRKMRNRAIVEYNGCKVYLSELCRMLGLPPKKITSRFRYLQKCGKPIDLEYILKP